MRDTFWWFVDGYCIAEHSR